MALPQNAQAIYQFLVGQGLSPNAAAGIAGNIQRESGGNPESVGTGGNGLIGWTPPLSGAVTGNSQKDLQFQLQHVMDYIKQNGSVADINAHAQTPTSAATYFSQKYERPGIPAIQQRIQSAVDVANAAKSGNWKGTGSPTPSGGGGGSGGLFSFPDQIVNFFTDAWVLIAGKDPNTGLGKTGPPWGGLMWLITPANWVRIAAFLAGVALLLVAVHALLAVGEGQPIVPKIQPVPVPV